MFHVKHLTLKNEVYTGPLRGGEVGYFPGAWTNRGPGALVNANVAACTVSYHNPFYVTKMHKIAPFPETGTLGAETGTLGAQN